MGARLGSSGLLGSPPRGLVTAFAVAGFALGLAACERPPTAAASAPSANPSDPADSAGVGSVAFELSIGGNYQFASLSYDISGNGFHRAATIDVSGSSTLSTLVAGIPLGAGYTAALTAKDVNHKLTDCTGTADFAVASAATVPVSVHMTCRAAATTPPPAVPVPRAAGYALAAVLLALGARRLRRPTA